MTTKDFIQQIRERIARDELAEAFRLLRGLLDNAPKLDEAILQSARFQDIHTQIRLGTVSPTEANLTKNQIRAGLLELLREIEDSVGVTSSHPDTTTSSGATVIQQADKIYNIDKIDNASFS